jgi:hypothetical protein
MLPSPPPAPAPRPPSALSAEAKLLRQAIERLHRHGDPAGALTALDEQRARFPAGDLREDADLVRLDALLALDRRAEALALLEGKPLDAGPRVDDLRVTRAELRAAGDCARALPDLDRALTRALPAPLIERALRARALCHVRRGDRPAAERDLRDYLTRFPDGRFAREARAHLGRQP